MNEIVHTIRSAKRTFTQDQWSEYCNSTRNNPENRIVTSFGKYDFNDFDICLNPTFMTLASKTGPFGYLVTLKWCECGNGLWSIALDFNFGNGGGGSGCSYTDTADGNSYRRGYRTEKEAILAICDKAIREINDYKCESKEMPKMNRLLEMVEDYKKSIGHPEPIQLSLNF